MSKDKIEPAVITMTVEEADLNSGNEIKTLLVDFYSGDIPIPPIIEALKSLIKQLEEDEQGS